MKRLAFFAFAGALLAFLALGGSGAAQESVDVEIGDQNDSGVTGTATVAAADDGTEVTINLSGLEPDSGHVNHIHDGTGCGAGEYAAVVQDLTLLEADADGNATATTMVDIAFADVANGGHVLVAHAGPDLEGENATPIACGAIPAAAADDGEDDGDGAADGDGTADKAPTVGSGGFLDQDGGGIGLYLIIAGALAAFGLGGVGAAFAVRRVRQ